MRSTTWGKNHNFYNLTKRAAQPEEKNITFITWKKEQHNLKKKDEKISNFYNLTKRAAQPEEKNITFKTWQNAQHDLEEKNIRNFYNFTKRIAQPEKRKKITTFELGKTGGATWKISKESQLL